MQEIEMPEVRASLGLLVLAEAVVLVFILACGLMAVRDRTFIAPLLLCASFGALAGFWLKRFRLQVSDGVIRYSSMLGGTRTLALGDVGSANMETGILRYRDHFRPAVRLVLSAKEAEGETPLIINIKVFRRQDIRRFLGMLAKRGLL